MQSLLKYLPAGLVFLACVILVLLLLALLGHLLAWRRTPRRQADVALVFGAGPGWEARARIAQAVEIYKAGKAVKLIASVRDAPGFFGQTDPEWFNEQLVSQGVPAENILLETASVHTAERVARALPILREIGARSVVLITSDFSSLRVFLLARRAWAGENLQIFSSPASSGQYWNRWTWWASQSGRHQTRYVILRLLNQDRRSRSARI